MVARSRTVGSLASQWSSGSAEKSILPMIVRHIMRPSTPQWYVPISCLLRSVIGESVRTSELYDDLWPELPFKASATLHTTKSYPRCRTGGPCAGAPSAGGGAPAGSGRRRCESFRAAFAADRCARRDERSGPARSPRRRGDLELAHEAIERDQLVRLERVEALATKQLLVARSHGHGQLVSLLAVLAVARAAATRRERPCLPGTPAFVGRTIGGRLLLGRDGNRPSVIGDGAVLPTGLVRTPRRRPTRTPWPGKGQRRTRRGRCSTASVD